MKAIISLLLALSFISISAFGFSSLSHSTDHRTPNCFASLVTLTDCPVNLVAFLEHYSSGVWEIFQTLLTNSVLFVLTLSSIGIFFGFLIFLKIFEHRIRVLLHRLLHASFFKRSRYKFSRWLSLLENSPSF